MELLEGTSEGQSKRKVNCIVQFTVFLEDEGGEGSSMAAATLRSHDREHKASRDLL